MVVDLVAWQSIHRNCVRRSDYTNLEYERWKREGIEGTYHRCHECRLANYEVRSFSPPIYLFNILIIKTKVWERSSPHAQMIERWWYGTRPIGNYIISLILRTEMNGTPWLILPSNTFRRRREGKKETESHVPPKTGACLFGLWMPRRSCGARRCTRHR